MANLPESPFWEAGIYQLETTDPVMAGSNGVDNFQAKQLANRTAFLKQLVGAGMPDILTVTASAVQNIPLGVTTQLTFDTIVRDDAGMLSPGSFSSFVIPTGYRYVSFKAGVLFANTPGTANGAVLQLGGTTYFAANTTSVSASLQASYLGASFATGLYPISGGEVFSADVISLLAAVTVLNTAYFQIELHK